MSILSKGQIISKQIAFILERILEAEIETTIKRIDIYFHLLTDTTKIATSIQSYPRRMNFDDNLVTDISEYSRIIYTYKKFKILSISYDFKSVEEEIDVDVKFSS